MEIIDTLGNLSAEEIQRRLNGQSPSVPMTGPSYVYGAPVEQKFYKLQLLAPVHEKVKVIKVVREQLGLGLYEAKLLIDSVPCIIKMGLTQNEAMAMQRAFATVGQPANALPE